MSSFGKVLDLLDDRYLNLQDVTGNAEPMPSLVPYEQYGQNVLVYRMDTEHDIFMGILQDFTMRRAQELGQELWTWCVQWEVDSLATSEPSPKKARLQVEQPESVPSVHPLQRKGPAYTVFERRILDPELLQEEDMLRILIDIVQVESSIVPNFIEFMYRWIDFYEGDGKALKAALRHEIPSLWDFEYHPLILPAEFKRRRKAFEKARKKKAGNATEEIQDGDKTPTNAKAEELAQSSPTKKMREIPDLAAMEHQLEQSERLKYREVKYGIQLPRVMVPFPPLINIPRDGYKRQQYYSACFRSRQRALTLLLEAGITIPQIKYYKKLQKAHPKDTPFDGDGDGLRYYEKDSEFAQLKYKQKQEDITLKEKTLEVSINDQLVTEALLAARSGRSEAPSGIPVVPSTLTLPHLREPDSRMDALIKSIAAPRANAKAKIGLVPAPLVHKMKSKVFDSAFDRQRLNALRDRTAFEPCTKWDESGVDVDMDDNDTDDDDSENDDDEKEDDNDINEPLSDMGEAGSTTLSLHPPPPSLPRGFHLPLPAPLPRPFDAPDQQQQSSNLNGNGIQQTNMPLLNQGAGLLSTYGTGRPALSASNQNAGAGTQGQAQGFPLLNASGRNIVATAQFAPAGPAGPSSHSSLSAVRATTIIPGPPLPYLPSTALLLGPTVGQAPRTTVSSLPPLVPPPTTSAPPVQPSRPMRLPPPLPPPPGFEFQAQSNRSAIQPPPLPQLGNMHGLNNASNPSARPPNSFVMGPPQSNPFQQTQSTQQQQGAQPPVPQLQPHSTIPRLQIPLPPPVSAAQQGQTLNAGSGPSQNTSLAAYLLAMRGQNTQANSQTRGQSTTQTLSTAQTAFPGMNSFTFPTPAQPVPASHSNSTPSSSQTSTILGTANLSSTTLPHPSTPGVNTAFFTPPRAGISRNAPTPLHLPPASPLSSLAPHLLATSPFAIHARPIPVQIYFPSIIVPGNLLGPSGLALGNAGARETDAVLAGHCVPGSGKIVLSKAIFLPLGVWTNMLRRVHRRAYKVLETYTVPGGHPAAKKMSGTNATVAGTAMAGATMKMDPMITATPHAAVYAKLAEAHSIMSRSPAREDELTKRWRTTPGPMTQRHRGAVWEGWGVTLERGIEMSAQERKGAMMFSALVDEGVDRKASGGDEEERRRREIEELLEKEEEDVSESEGESESEDGDDGDGDEDMEGRVSG